MARENSEERRSSKFSPTQEKKIYSGISYYELFKFSSGRDKLYILASLLFAISAGILLQFNSLCFGFLFQSMVEYNVTTQDKDLKAFIRAIQKFSYLVTLIGLFLVILTYASTSLINIAAHRQGLRIREEYLKATLHQDASYFELHGTGHFPSRILYDVSKVEQGIGDKLATFVYNQAGLVSSVVMAFSRGWKLTLICMISFPITLFLAGIAALGGKKFAKKELKVLSHATSVAQEALSAIRTVHAFSGQEKDVKYYHNYLMKASVFNRKKAIYNAIAMSILYICIYHTFAVAIRLGYYLMRDEPEVYNANNVLTIFLQTMSGIVNIGNSLTLMDVFGEARGAAEHIFGLIKREPVINRTISDGIVLDSVEGNIELKNVVFYYPSRPEVTVLKGVSLSITRGRSVALVGHSGSGKSTIIQLICRYYDVVEGSVTLDGKDVRELSVPWLRSQIGLVLPDPVLFSTTVRENIRYGRETSTDEEIIAAARLADAHHFVNRLPQGYDTMVGELGASLSGGQKQRIAIARALIRNPVILLMDEATSALDAESKDLVQTTIYKIQEQRCTLIVANLLTTIQHVDLIYVLDDGRVVESGNHEELMNIKGHYYHMIALQTSPDEFVISKDQDPCYWKLLALSKEEFFDEQPKTEYPAQPIDEVKATYMQLLKLCKSQAKSLFCASLCAYCNGFGTPILALVLSRFILTITIPNEDPEELWELVTYYTITLLVIGVMAGITQFGAVFLFITTGDRVIRELKKKMFEKLIHQDLSFYDEQINLVTVYSARLSSQPVAVQEATGLRVGSIIQTMGSLSIALSMAMYYEWRIGLYGLLFVPILALLFNKQGRMITSYTIKTSKMMDQAAHMAIEAVRNACTVALLGRENTIVRNYAEHLQKVSPRIIHSIHCRGVVFGASRGVVNLVYATAVLLGGMILVTKEPGLELQSVIEATQAIMIGSASSSLVFQHAPYFNIGVINAGRILTLLKRTSKLEDPAKPAVENFRGTGSVSLKDVSFSYPSRPLLPVLKKFTLDIESGKTIALIGANGNGKTTIIRLLERFYDPDSGQVLQDGIPLTQLRIADVRQTIGLVERNSKLFHYRTIGENIAYGDNSRTPTIEEIVEVAVQANIDSFIKSLPMGYNNGIGSGVLISTGQKQRIALARALIRKPKLLLLDEATSYLDSTDERLVQDALDNARHGRTCVVITQKVSTARDADLLVVVHAGHIVESGTYEELMNAKGIYHTLYSLENFPKRSSLNISVHRKS